MIPAAYPSIQPYGERCRIGVITSFEEPEPASRENQVNGTINSFKRLTSKRILTKCSRWRRCRRIPKPGTRQVWSRKHRCSRSPAAFLESSHSLILVTQCPQLACAMCARRPTPRRRLELGHRAQGLLEERQVELLRQ